MSIQVFQEEATQIHQTTTAIPLGIQVIITPQGETSAKYLVLSQEIEAAEEEDHLIPLHHLQARPRPGAVLLLDQTGTRTVLQPPMVILSPW